MYRTEMHSTWHKYVSLEKFGIGKLLVSEFYYILSIDDNDLD